MDSFGTEQEKGSLSSKVYSEKSTSYIRNVPHAMHLREIGTSRYQNQVASELQIAAEEQLAHKQYEETKCELPDVTRSTYLVVFSPDGQKMASSHGNHNVYVTDVKTGKNLNTLSGHPRTPWCIAFHPSSNQILASGCLGGQVRVWDLHGGSEIWTVEGQTSIASLAFHPTDRLLVVASYNEILFWDWSQPEPFAKCCTQNEKEKIRYVAFDFAGTKLITGIENPQPLQTQWDRIGPVRYVPHSGSPRGPRPIGPRPGFGSVFSHSNTSPGPGSGPGSGPGTGPGTGPGNSPGTGTAPTPHPSGSSPPQGTGTSHVIPRHVRHDDRRSISRLFDRVTPELTPRTAATSTASTLNGNLSSSGNNHRGGDNRASPEHGQSWMWRSQHSSRDSIHPQTPSRFRLWPLVISRRSTESGRVSWNHRRHLQVLLDQCRRLEQRSFQSVHHLLQFSSSSVSSAENRLGQVPSSMPQIASSLPRHTEPTSVESGNFFHDAERGDSEASHSSVSSHTANRNRSSRLESAVPQQRPRIMERISAVSEDVRRVLQVLSEQISSLQQCSQCQPRMNSFRLNHIRQLWTEIQGQIRSLQVSIWENAGLASNAWHRYSFEAITEMLSHMSHQDRLEERLTNASLTVSPSAVERDCSSAPSSDELRPLNSSTSDRSSLDNQSATCTISENFRADAESTERSAGISNPTTLPPAAADSLTTQSSLVASSPDQPVISSNSSENIPLSTLSPSSTMFLVDSPQSAPHIDHSVFGGREREALHITWVDRNSRGRTAVGVVSRQDGSNGGDPSLNLPTEAHLPTGSSLRGRLFRPRRQNAFTNTSFGLTDVSRNPRSSDIRPARTILETFRANSEPRASQQTFPARNFERRQQMSRRSSSLGTLSDGQFEDQLSSFQDEASAVEPSQLRPETEPTEASLRSSLPETGSSQSPLPSARPATRRMSDHSSLLRWRLLLRKPRFTAWRSIRSRSSSQSTHGSARSFGGRRGVLEVAVDASTRQPCLNYRAGNFSPRTGGIERAPDNMLLRIFRSLRRCSSPHRPYNPLQSSTSSGSSLVQDALALPPLVEESPSVSEPSVSESSDSPLPAFNPSSSDSDSGRARWSQPMAGHRLRQTNGSQDGSVTEEWAHRLLRLHLHQQQWERQLQQHQARLRARYLSSALIPSSQVTRDFHRRSGQCPLCGGSTFRSSNFLLDQDQNNRGTTNSSSGCQAHGSAHTNQATSSPPHTFQRRLRQSSAAQSTSILSTNSLSNSSGSFSEPDSGLHNSDPGLSVETNPSDNQREMSTRVTTPSTSHAEVSSDSGTTVVLPNHYQNVKVENSKILKPNSSSKLCSGLLSSSKLIKSSKGRDIKNNASSQRRPQHQAVNKKKLYLKSPQRTASDDSRSNHHQNGLGASSSQARNFNLGSNSPPRSDGQIPSQLPDPTFLQQLETVFIRLDHLMSLQRNALQQPTGEHNGSNVNSPPHRYSGEDRNNPSDAICTTSRMLTRLTESLVRQIQMVQRARQHHDDCLQPTAPLSETRRRAEELLSVMMESLATFSRDSSFGETLSDNSALEHIQTMSASFWLLHGLYMSLHLALDLTDVLLNHFISSYETNGPHIEEPRAPLAHPCVCPTSGVAPLHPWATVRSAFVPPHTWSHSSSSSSTGVTDERLSPTSSSSSSTSQTRESRLSNRFRLINRVSSYFLHSTQSNSSNGTGTPSSSASGALNSASPRNRAFPHRLHIDTNGDNEGAGSRLISSSVSSQSPHFFRSPHHVRLSVPSVQVNDVPLSEINEWQSSSNTNSASPDADSSSRDALSSSSEHTRWTSPIIRTPPQVPQSVDNGRPGPFRVRPRLLHPHYTRHTPDPFLANDGDYAAQSLLFHLDYSRGGASFVREPFLSTEEHRIHRIQLWDFSEGIIPDITKADKNLVVGECKIHNDASVDVSAEGHLLVALLPISRTVLHPHLAPTVGQSVGVYSLVWESLGQLLYTTSLDQAAVSVALSPTAAYLLVGLVSRRTVLMPSDHHALAQIFRLEGARPGRPIGARGRLNLHRDIELQRDHVASSLNCIRWAPMPGQGFIYGTNTGALVMLR